MPSRTYKSRYTTYKFTLIDTIDKSVIQEIIDYILTERFTVFGYNTYDQFEGLVIFKTPKSYNQVNELFNDDFVTHVEQKDKRDTITQLMSTLNKVECRGRSPFMMDQKVSNIHKQRWVKYRKLEEFITLPNIQKLWDNYNLQK